MDIRPIIPLEDFGTGRVSENFDKLYLYTRKAKDRMTQAITRLHSDALHLVCAPTTLEPDLSDPKSERSPPVTGTSKVALGMFVAFARW